MGCEVVLVAARTCQIRHDAVSLDRVTHGPDEHARIAVFPEDVVLGAQAVGAQRQVFITILVDDDEGDRGRGDASGCQSIDAITLFEFQVEQDRGVIAFAQALERGLAKCCFTGRAYR